MRTLNFEELNLSKNTLNALNNANLKEVSPLQQSIISNTHNNQSVVIKAEAGNDKNTAFAIAGYDELQQRDDSEGTAAIIITAKSDTARGICNEINTLAATENICICADNDGSIEEQAEAFEEGPDIIVANPERLQQLLQQHRFIFRHAKIMILDSLDKMLESGQFDNLKRIKRRILSDYTTVICTESYNSQIKKVASKFAKKPVVIGFGKSANGQAIGTPPPIAGHLKQGYINVPYRMKISTLMAHIDQTPKERCVVFTASKRGTDRLYRVLKKRGLKATSLHGKLSEEKQAQRFSNFTNSDVQYLLVADISAAELEVSGVDQVINYDVPNSSDEYRFRAALASSVNKARIVSLVSKQDRSDISELQNELGQTPDEISLPKEVKEKLKQRRNKKSNGKNKRTKNQKKKKQGMQLPQPSYDKLSGGRNGNHDEKKTGIVKFFKKLFS